MAGHQTEDRGEPNLHRFSLAGSRLASYYGNGDLLKAKHQATDAAADRFPDWVLGLVDGVPARRALDAGCGWGRFSMPLLQRRGSDAPDLVCSDIYPGMLRAAEQTLTEAGLHASYVAADIEHLPFQPRSFDLAMANHVLYHMSNVPAAAAELARVLGDDGILVATTNSDRVRIPLLEIHWAVLREIGVNATPEEASKFSMDNGADLLATAFADVRTHVFEHTVYYDVDTLVNVYLNTGRYRAAMADAGINEERRAQLASRFRARAEQWLAEEGEIASPQRMSAFVCSGPRRQP